MAERGPLEQDLGLREADCGCCYIVDKVALDELLGAPGWLVGLTDDERDLLRDWWDEDTTVGVESSFPIISRIIAARLAPVRALADEWQGENAWGIGEQLASAIHLRTRAELPADAIAEV